MDNKYQSNTRLINDCSDTEDVSQQTQTQERGADRTEITTLSPRIRFLKTFCMWMMYIGLGGCIGVAYSTVVDMVEKYHASYDDVTIAQMMKAIGLMTGCIFGTPITDRFRKRADLFIFVFGCFYGITLAAIPWSPNLIGVGFLFYANGLCHSTIDICCVTICLAIWKEKATATIGGLYTCLAIGQTISPLITAPFLSEPVSSNQTAPNLLSDVQVYISFGYEYIYAHEHYDNQTMTESHMQIPYGIFGGWAILIAFMFLIFHVTTTGYGTTERRNNVPLKAMFNPGTCANGSVCYGLYGVLSLFFGYFFLNGRDRGFGMFVFTVANKSIHVSKSISAVILFSYNGVGTLARALCAFISIYVPIQVLMLILVLGAVITQTIAVFFALESVTSFWILTCVMAVFITPTYPLLMAWMDRYIEMNGVVMGILNIGTGCGGLSCMFLSSYAFQNFSSQAVVILALIYGTGLALVFVPLQIISHMRGTRDRDGGTQYTRIEDTPEETDSDTANDIDHVINRSVDAEPLTA